MGFCLAFLLQNYVRAQTDVSLDKKPGDNSKATLQSEKSQQDIKEQNKAQKSDPDPDPSDDLEPLDFTPLGRSGQQTAGESRGSCPYASVPLSVVAPKSNVSLTAKSHPKFWFYLPYDQSKISRLEFSIVDEVYNETTRIELPVPQDKSYIVAALPENKPGLIVNSPYKWHLKVYCNIGNKKGVPTFVSGTLVRRKVATNPDTTQDFGSSNKNIQELMDQDLWIDAVHVLLEKDYINKTSKTKLWQSLLSSSEINLMLPDPQNINNVQVP